MQEQDESLILHLEALRTMLIKCFVALGVGLLPMFLAAPYGMNGLIKIIIGNNNVSLNYFSPMEVFILQIKIAVVLDLLICFPYIAHQIWKFLLPALYDNERRFIKSIVFASSGLFIIGVLFCIFFILPLIINFGISFATPDIKAVFGISNIIGLAVINENTCIKCGLCVLKCPRGAISKEDGSFPLINTDECIGCGACQNACPVKAITVMPIEQQKIL